MEELEAALGRELTLQAALRNAALRNPQPWPAPRINEKIPESLMRTLQRRESERREAQLRRLWRQQQTTHLRLEREIEAEAKPPATGATSPASTRPPSGEPETTVPFPDEKESGFVDARPRLLLAALLLALVGSITLLVAWLRRRHGRDRGIVLDQPSQDALVGQFRRYLRSEDPT